MVFRRTKRSGSEPRKGHWLLWTLSFTAFCFFLICGLVVFALLRQFEQSLPSIKSLEDYHPPVVSSMYAADGSLLAEFYDQRRYLLSPDQMPSQLIEAFLAAEDARFFEHKGLDIAGIVRAFFKNLEAGEIVQGGSTITQQVVKSLLLTPERTLMRKLKEAVLAYRLDNSLSKQDILYLYLNQIYLGGGAYGVEAAARIYFGKHVSQLSLAQDALLAGLPKAPSRYSPHRNVDLAVERQRYVLERMVETGFITAEAAEKARAAPLGLIAPRKHSIQNLDYFSEEVRRRLEDRYGHKMLYEEGFQIYTTLQPKAQQYAQEAVEEGLRELDKRHGYRGPEKSLQKDEWPDFLETLKNQKPEDSEGQITSALIIERDRKGKAILLSLGDSEAELDLDHSEWPASTRNSLRKSLQVGDVIQVKLGAVQEDGRRQALLEQEPKVEGAMLALEQATGKVICMVGGRSFKSSQFNRAVQAIRQPGSAFKPIIYAAALDKGYSPASVLIDSPIIKEDPSLTGPWKPANYDHKFNGPILLRQALIHSRNVVTIKLLDAVGIDYVVDYAHHLGIKSDLTPTLSLALGASGVSLWELLTAYTAFANQGIRSEPHMIDSIRDRNGKILEQVQPEQESVISPETAYLVTHILQGVIQEGTGQRVRVIGRPAAGKTGTTNDLKDAWFIGYTPTVLAGAWVGQDDHRKTLGRRETGSRAAAPIWLAFMRKWLQDKPVEDFPIPQDIVFARIDEKTGRLTTGSDKNADYVAFAKGTLPAPGQDNGPTGSSTSTTQSFFKSELF